MVKSRGDSSSADLVIEAHSLKLESPDDNCVVIALQGSCMPI
jgi:hypothetical protein